MILTPQPPLQERVRKLEYCPFHTNTKKFKYVPFKVTEKDGTANIGRKCEKCAVTINVVKTAGLDNQKIEAYTNEAEVKGIK